MANTTNLNLVKPGLDDDALITDINDNMDKIDTFAGSANTAIANVNTTTVISALTDIPVNSKGRIKLAAAICPTGAELPVNYICVGTSSRQTIIVDANTAGRTFINSRRNDNDWTGWNELAINKPTTVTTGVFTPSTGITVLEQKYSTFGAYHEMIIRVKSNSAISARTLLGTVASSYRPSDTVRAVCSAASVANGNLNRICNGFILSSNGNVNIDVINSDTIAEINLIFTWIE